MDPPLSNAASTSDRLSGLHERPVPATRGLAVLEVNPMLAVPSRGPSPMSYGAVPQRSVDAQPPPSPGSRKSTHPLPPVGAPSVQSVGLSTSTSIQQANETVSTPRMHRECAADEEEELIPTPILSKSSKAESYSAHTSFAYDLPRYAVITFDMRTRCPPGEEYLVVSKVKSSMRVVAPRCRIQAFKERLSHDDEDLFDGVVQVVPMFSMLQVSLESVWDSPALRRLAASPRFWCTGLCLNFLLFGLLQVQQNTPAQQAPLAPLTIAIVSNTVMVVLVAALFALQCSRQMSLLILRSFDWWMLQFWIVITIVCNVNYTRVAYPEAPLAMRVCEGIGLVVSLEVVLWLDAFPALPRRWKGGLYLVSAGFNLYRYVHWFISVRMDVPTAHATIDFGSFALHLATAGQSAGAALVAYYSRLGMRALWKKLDLQLVDFPVNMVPHLDEEAARRARMERLQQQQQHGRRPSSTLSPNASSSKEALLRQQQHATTAPRCSETAQEHHGSYTEGAANAPRDSTLQWSHVEQTWLHVQGSLPCKHEHVTSTCRRLQTLVAEQGGKISFAVVEDSTVFDCDRRTFEPHCFMMSFSPKPLVSIPIVFRGLSTSLWVNMSMTCVVLGSVVMFLINAFDRSNYVLMSAVQAYLFSIAVVELLCGVSCDMVRHALLTLDFWYVLTVFASQIFSGVVIYSSSYNVALAVMHTLMVISTTMFISTMDCIVLTQFNGRVKGVIGATLAIYCLVDLLWTTPAAIREKPEVYNKSLNLYFSEVSPGSIAIIANMACFLVFLRVAGRTLWMKSRLVFMQFGAKEELVHDSDAALMASGGFSNNTSNVAGGNLGSPTRGRLTSAPTSRGAHPSPHVADSTSQFATSRVSFFGGYLGDEATAGGGASASHWRNTVRANKNAKFVKLGRGRNRKGDPTSASPPCRQGGVSDESSVAASPSNEDMLDDNTESDTSAIRFV